MALREGWITTAAAAELIGLDRSYITRLARTGRIEAQKVGEGRTGLWFVHRDSVLAYKAEMDAAGEKKYTPEKYRE